MLIASQRVNPLLVFEAPVSMLIPWLRCSLYGIRPSSFVKNKEDWEGKGTHCLGAGWRMDMGKRTFANTDKILSLPFLDMFAGLTIGQIAKLPSDQT